MSQISVFVMVLFLSGCELDETSVEPVPKACVSLDFWFSPGNSGWDFQRLSARLFPIKGTLPPVSIPHEVQAKKGRFMWVRLNRLPSDATDWLNSITSRALEVAEGEDLRDDGFKLARFTVTDDSQKNLFSWKLDAAKKK